MRFLISHIDLDGYGCVLMAQRYFGTDVQYRCVNYDELQGALESAPKDAELYITDLSIPISLKPILMMFKEVTVVDHHKTSLWLASEDTLKEMREHGCNLDSHISTERCATYLLYDYLSLRFGYKDTSLDRWAELVDDYDRYVLSFPESKRLNALFYISDRERFVKEGLYSTPDEFLAKSTYKVDNYLKAQREYVLNTRTIPLSGESFKAILCFAEKNKSAIGEYYIQEQGYDLVYILDTHTMSMSIRSGDSEQSIDCSRIAERFGGGGHSHSSGFSLSEDYENLFADLSDTLPSGMELEGFLEEQRN